MDFRQMIEKAVEIKGSGRKLAECLDVPEQHISGIKRKERGLPDAGCLKLAQILGFDFGKVIAARNEWTAKSEEERNFWHPLANAAGIVAICASIVTLYLTPAPAQAAPIQGFARTGLCIMSNMKNRIRRILREIAAIAFDNRKDEADNYNCGHCTAPA